MVAGKQTHTYSCSNGSLNLLIGLNDISNLTSHFPLVFAFFVLTAFNFQGAVLFIKWVPPQVHHARCSGGYSVTKKGQKQNTMKRKK